MQRDSNTVIPSSPYQADYMIGRDNGFRSLKHCHCGTTVNRPASGLICKQELDVGLVYNASNGFGVNDGKGCEWSYILIPDSIKSNQWERIIAVLGLIMWGYSKSVQ